MNEELLPLLQSLTRIMAPTGFEMPASRFVYDYLQGFAEEVSVDVLGNVLGRVTSARPGAPRMLLFAHLDEVGFMVKKIEANGFLRIARLGGIPEKSMASVRLEILGSKGTVSGVIGTRAHHLSQPEHKYRVVPLDEAYVDVGRGSREEVLALGIDVGTPAVYQRQFWTQGSAIYANALDDRAGLAALLTAGKELANDPPVGLEIWLAATVQEEWSLKGIQPVVHKIKPQAAIGVDIAAACDTPELAGSADVSLGKGPVLSAYTFHGRGMLLGLIPDQALFETARMAAEAAKVPIQRAVFFGGLTDASFAQYEEGGIASLDIALPLRYTHAPIECCDAADVQRLITWLVAIAPTWCGQAQKSRRDMVIGPEA